MLPLLLLFCYAARKYNQRYKVCETCLKLPSVPVAGRDVRFCQQCSCFHDVTSFDGKKRSCREQLEKHNKRRRERIEAATAKAMGAGMPDISTPEFSLGSGGKRSRMQPMDSVSSNQMRNLTGGSFISAPMTSTAQGAPWTPAAGQAGSLTGQSVTTGNLPAPAAMQVACCPCC